MNDQTIIFIGVGIYLLAMLAIGAFAARRTTSSEDFIVAGRSLPLWLCSGTVMATWIGGGSMLGVSGQAYEGGTLAVIADPFGAAVGLILVGLFVIRILRRLRLLTVIDFIENRFGRAAAAFSALAMVSSSIGWAGALMVAFGFVLNALTGLDLEIGIVIGLVIVLAYTAAGGMWAVAMTDFAQLIIIVLGLLILLVVVVSDMGGWSVAWSGVPATKTRMIPFENDAATWLNYLRAWFIIGIANLSSQSLLQRGLSARNESVAQNSFYIGGLGFLAVGLVPVMLGILASTSMPGLEDQETIIPMLAMEHLHPVFMAVFVGALLAAVVVPFVLGIWWKASNRTGALAAMAAGIFVWILSSWLWPSLPGDLLGLLACLLTMLLVTPLTQRSDPPRPLLSIDGEEVQLRDRLGILWNRNP
jgi:SSS family solute:Na+ symporter